MKLHERFATLASKSKLTAKEREFIVEHAVKNDLQINTLCKECYKDAAIVLYGIYKPKDADEKDGRLWVLRKGLDVIFNGKRINEATLTDTLAYKIVEQGFPTRFFTRMPS